MLVGFGAGATGLVAFGFGFEVTTAAGAAATSVSIVSIALRVADAWLVAFTVRAALSESAVSSDGEAVPGSSPNQPVVPPGAAPSGVL